MVQNKNNKAIWNTRIKKNTSSIFKKVGSSIDVDKRLFKEDIQGSIAHVEMLFKQNIISFKIKNKIIWGLNRIKNEIIKKKFNFNSNLEDIHMNIENRLFEIIGEDDLENLDSDTLYFMSTILNQLNLDSIRNKILLKVLPLKI